MHETAEHRLFDRSSGPTIPSDIVRPRSLPKSKSPLTIVCGAPGSGKSTWVRAMMSDAAIIDLDDITDRLMSHKGARVPGRSQYLRRALEARNRELTALAKSDAPAACFIVGAPTADERRHWAGMLGAFRTVVLLTPMAETLRRIAADPVRMWVQRPLQIAVKKWWLEYTPGHAEEVIDG